MYAVIFEVRPKAGREQEYLALAQELRAELEKVDGFISIERFASLYTEGKLLSLSFWRDEIFADYRIRVAGVVRDYGMNERAQAPQ